MCQHCDCPQSAARITQRISAAFIARCALLCAIGEALALQQASAVHLSQCCVMQAFCHLPPGLPRVRIALGATSPLVKSTQEGCGLVNKGNVGHHVLGGGLDGMIPRVLRNRDLVELIEKWLVAVHRLWVGVRDRVVACRKPPPRH